MKRASIAYLKLIDYFSGVKEPLGAEYGQRVGCGQGTFNWFTKEGEPWYAESQDVPDILSYNNKKYLYGAEGHRKLTLNDLKQI